MKASDETKNYPPSFGDSMMSGSMKIGSKIFLLVGFCLALGVLASGISIWQMNKIGVEIEAIAERDIPLTDALTQITIHQLQQAINFERAFRAGQMMKQHAGSREEYAKAVRKFKGLTGKIETEFVEVKAIARRALDTAIFTEERQEFRSVLTMLDKLDTEHKEYDKQSSMAFKLISAGQIEQAIALLPKIEAEEEDLVHQLEKMLFHVEGFTLSAAKTVEAHERFALKLLLAITAISLVVGTNTAYFMVKRNITRPLDEIVAGLEALGADDMSVEVKVHSDDEIGAVAKAYADFKKSLIEAKSLQISRKHYQDLSEEYERSNKELQKFAIVRQNFLDKEILNKKILKEKNQRLSELYETAHRFVDNVSHEFRTPLTVIKEFTSITRDGLAGDVSDQQREYLGIVINRVDDLSLMVDDMLDISRLEAGGLSMARTQCSAEQIIEHIKTTLETKAAARKVTLSVEIDPSLPPLYCDAEKIRRVIINLVINAFKFSDEGGHIVLKVTPRAENSEIVFCITDDGPGISPENLQAIFARFKQVSGNIRTSTKGFGLGLNIAKELVHLNFGDIDVKSELGKGSSFSFTVPTFDPPKILHRFLDKVEDFRDKSSRVSLFAAEIQTPVDSDAQEDVEQFLQQQLHRNDLLICPRPGRWLLTIATDSDEPEQIIARVEKARLDANRDRPGLEFPAIDLELKGTWRTLDQGNEFVREFEAEFGGSVLAGDESKCVSQGGA